MKTPRLVAALVASGCLALPGGAIAQDLGWVTGYNLPEIRTFTADGRPMGPQRRADLPTLPAPIVEVRQTTYGIRRGGEVIFVRGIDVRLEGVGECRPRDNTQRAEGSYRPGVDAGSGTSLDCRRQP